MLEHCVDKAKIIQFFCDLRKRRSGGLIDNFTWRELELSGKGKFSWLLSCIKTQWDRRSHNLIMTWEYYYRNIVLNRLFCWHKGLNHSKCDLICGGRNIY